MRGGKWWVLSVTSVGALLAALNFSTLIIALPDLIRSLHSGLLPAVWVMIGYMVAQTVMALIGGSLADHLGRNRVYTAGMAAFTLFSLLSGCAPGVAFLIGMRILQGVGGALVMANSTAIVAEEFEGSELGTALGINVMVVALGQILGPVLGGWLTTAYGWRWVFWFNVPFGVLGVLWALWILPRDRQRTGKRARKVDLSGVSLYLLSVTGLLMGLTVGAVAGWNDPWAYGFLAVGAVGLPLWLWAEGRSEDPLLHLGLFRIREFAIGNLTATLNAIARMAVMFLMIFYLQGAKGETALQAGIALIPMALAMMLASPFSGRLADRFGTVVPATAGIALTALGLALMAATLSLTTPYPLLVVDLVLVGVGSGFFNAANSSSMMHVAGPRFRGEASGIRSLTTNTGMMFGVVFTLALVTGSIPRQAMWSIFAGTEVGLKGAAPSSLDGFIAGTHLALWSMVVLTVVAALLSLLRGGRKRRMGEASASP